MARLARISNFVTRIRSGLPEICTTGREKVYITARDRETGFAAIKGLSAAGTAGLPGPIAAFASSDEFMLGAEELRHRLCASRSSRTNAECAHALRLPSLCIIAQGAKTVIVGQEVYEYDPSRMLVFSVALPIAAQITQASHSKPYLALRLDLDPHKGEASHVVDDDGRGYCESARGLSKRFPVQQRIQPLFRECAD